MLSEFRFTNVYIACGYTDLRFGVDGLARLVESRFELSPFMADTLFLFCGRRNDRIKGLLWEGDGFLLLYKRLEAGRFQWPRNNGIIYLWKRTDLQENNCITVTRIFWLNWY